MCTLTYQNLINPNFIENVISCFSKCNIFNLPGYQSHDLVTLYSRQLGTCAIKTQEPFAVMNEIILHLPNGLAYSSHGLLHPATTIFDGLHSVAQVDEHLSTLLIFLAYLYKYLISVPIGRLSYVQLGAPATNEFFNLQFGANMINITTNLLGSLGNVFLNYEDN